MRGGVWREGEEVEEEGGELFTLLFSLSVLAVVFVSLGVLVGVVSACLVRDLSPTLPPLPLVAPPRAEPRR